VEKFGRARRATENNVIRRWKYALCMADD